MELEQRSTGCRTADWESLIEWYHLNGRHRLPWRAESDSWAVLLAECLLHRTKADQVARVYAALLASFPSPARIVADPSQWEQSTRSLGLAWRVDQARRMAEVLLKRHNGTVPSSLNELCSLPGIGHYKASAVRCFAFGLPAVLVDTNTIRVAARVTGYSLFQGSHRSPQTRDRVRSLKPDGTQFTRFENLALLDLAAIVCTIRQPSCRNCPLRTSCSHSVLLAAD